MIGKLSTLLALTLLVWGGAKTYAKILDTSGDVGVPTAYLLDQAAQDFEVTGTIQATLGGEERSWNTRGFETPDGYQATSSWSLISDIAASLALQGYTDDSFQVEEILSVEFASLGGFPNDCPCTFAHAEVGYWTTSSMFGDVYLTDEGEVTLTSVEQLGEDTYRIEGTFRGTLTFEEDVVDDISDPDNTLEVEGSFVIERLVRFTY